MDLTLQEHKHIVKSMQNINGLDVKEHVNNSSQNAKGLDNLHCSWMSHKIPHILCIEVV